MSAGERTVFLTDVNYSAADVITLSLEIKRHLFHGDYVVFVGVMRNSDLPVLIWTTVGYYIPVQLEIINVVCLLLSSDRCS